MMWITLWIILWYLCGLVAGAVLVYKSYERTGEVSLGDVFRIFVAGPLLGAAGLLIVLLLMSDEFTLYKKK